MPARSNTASKAPAIDFTTPGKGIDVKVQLDKKQTASGKVSKTGGSVSLTNDQSEAFQGARAVYAKAWGPATSSGLGAAEVSAHSEWQVDRAHMAKAAVDAIFLHCLPVRRNVEVADEVLDHPSSRVVDEAENRFHVQRALMDWLLNT